MGAEGAGTIPVCIDGLDATMARSVRVFLEARHPDHFTIADRPAASVLLVDLDQPHAPAELTAAAPGQVVIGVGFAAEAALACRHYIQKPLNGTALIDALSEAVEAVGSPSAARARAWEQRPSHARDIFTKGRAWEPAARPAPAVPTAPRSTAARVATLDRPAVVAPPIRVPADRGPRIVDLVDEEGSAGGAAEVLGRRIDVEHVEARSTGDLRDPSVLASYRYDPAEHLDGLLGAVARRHPGEPWIVQGSLHTLIGDPATGSVLVCGPEAQLARLAALPVEGAWSTRRTRPLPDPSEAQRVPLEVLVWNASVWASAGRLADAVDPFGLVAARTWPDVPRLALPPGLLPTIALLAQRPARPAELPERLDLPRSHVFTVLSALEACGLLIRPDAAPPGGSATGTAPTDAPVRGVLQRLIGRLRDR